MDDEGEGFDVLVQRRRGKVVALNRLGRRLHNPPVQPGTITTDGLTTRAATYTTFDIQRHPISKPTHRRFRADADTAWAAGVG